MRVSWLALAWVPAGLALLLASPSCSPDETTSRGSVSSIVIDCRFDPAPPVIGLSTIELTLADLAGVAIAGASVRVEGNMNHPGMVPEIVDAREIAPGRYRATIEFTMGGDWFLLVEVRLADGRRLERTIEVPKIGTR